MSEVALLRSRPKRDFCKSLEWSCSTSEHQPNTPRVRSKLWACMCPPPGYWHRNAYPGASDSVVMSKQTSFPSAHSLASSSKKSGFQERHWAMEGSIRTSRQRIMKDMTAESMSHRTRQPNSNNHEWAESVEDGHTELLRQVDISESGTGRAAEVLQWLLGRVWSYWQVR